MRKHKSDRIIGLMTLILLIAGLIVIYAIGPMRVNFMNAAYGSELSENYFFVHQLINVTLSVAAFIIAFKFPYEKLRKYGKWVLFLGFFLCGVLFVAAKAGSGLAKCELGACRWMNLGGFGSLQPAEILKLGLVLYLSQLAAERKKEGKINSSDFWIPAGLMSVISLVFVVVLQKDLGSGVVLVAIILATIFMSGIELKKFLLVLGTLTIAGVLAVVSSPHRMERIMTFMDGEGSDKYHIENALIAIGTGGLAGVGVGNSVQATGYLPESINDSVFAVMGETFGFIGLSAVVLVFVVLLTRILRIAELGQTDEHKLIAIGIFSWIGVQMAVNIMAMTGLIPLTGITLPLLSYGGTSMMFVTIALGLAGQLSCYTRREAQVEQKRFSNGHLKGGRLHENSSRRRR
ncbi:FtsW/RodA/SpoVE family cell cycle protein [Candidatus Saccharibacteria bacterium]|nr:FtsW/RodA/SpoVE family cell cycle protein [Candidatus Saccharibacteria bacterium]